MSEIKITYPLDCHKDHSKNTVQEMLHALEAKYGIKHNFINEHECTLSGSGVSGEISIEENSIEVFAKLGFFMMPFKTVIETEIINKLNEYFENHA